VDRPRARAADATGLAARETGFAARETGFAARDVGGLQSGRRGGRAVYPTDHL